MNEDHGDQLLRIVQHAVPLGGCINKAVMTGLDRFGMDVQCTDEKGEAFSCRVPFPRFASCCLTPSAQSGLAMLWQAVTTPSL